MKTIITNIWQFLCALGEANYAAHLARNGKWKEAQEIAQK
jgi:hypothetical protein